MTAGAGAWNGDPPLTYAYQWQRCDTNGANCTTIDGATNGTYAVATADIGHTLRVDVTASNAAGHASSGSDATGIVVAAHVPPRIARIHARRALGVVHLALTACTDSTSRLRVRTQTRAWTLPAAAGCRSISESWRAPRRGRLVIVVRVTDDSGASSAPVRMTLR